MRRLVSAVVAAALLASQAAAQIDFAARGMAARALGRPAVLPSNRGTFMMTAPQFVSGGFTAMPANPWSFLTTFPVPCSFTAWRPIFGNYAGASYTVSGVAFQASTGANDYIHPVGGGGWLYNSAANGGALSGTGVDQPRDGAASMAAATGYPLTIPAAATDANTATLTPSFAAGDWNTLSSVDPSDGGNAHYLMVRTLIPYQANWGGAVQVGTAGWTGVPAINTGFDYAPAPYKNSDVVTDPSVSVTGFGTNTVTALLGIQFLSEQPVISVGTVGDSTSAGQTTAQGIAPYTTRATLQLTNETGTCFTPVNAAWGGASSNLFWPTARGIFAFARPQIVFVQSWTSNDTNDSQAAVDKTFARMMHLAEQVRSWGGVPILVTPLPREPSSMAVAGRLAGWKYIRQRVLAAGRHGALVFDATPVVGDVNTGLYLPGMSNDAIHPNDTGAGALVPGAKAAIRRAMGI